jgi:hypothetical protein
VVDEEGVRVGRGVGDVGVGGDEVGAEAEGGEGCEVEGGHSDVCQSWKRL